MRVLMLSILLLFTTTLSFATEKKMTEQTKVKLTTSLGEIVIVLNSEKAPVSVANFLSYVKEGFYTGTLLVTALVRASAVFSAKPLSTSSV